METKQQSEIVLRASQQMFESIKNDDLESDEMWEWYGYVRALRDMAFELRLDCTNETQDNLDEALKIVLEKHKLLQAQENK